MVVTVSCGYYVDLQKFAKLNGFTIDENYPIGVHCKNNKILGMVTVFRTGKMISVGTKNLKDAKASLALILNLLKKQRNRVEIKN